MCKSVVLSARANYSLARMFRGLLEQAFGHSRINKTLLDQAKQHSGINKTLLDQPTNHSSQQKVCSGRQCNAPE
jgi:hypothetical protein